MNRRTSFLTLLLAVFCAAPLLARAADSPPHHAQNRRVPGAPDSEQIAKSITIYRDNYGVPHVFGPTDAACAFGYMYAQAEDNFWQIEDSYIRSLGRASEVYGAKTLEDDELVRALEIPRLAQAEYAQMPARTKAVMDGATEGLNYFLAHNPQVKPRLLTHFEPWYGLAFNRYALYFQFIFRRSGLRPEEIKSVVEPQTAKPAAAIPARRDSGHRDRDKDAENASAIDYKTAAETQGSNMWAVMPAKSADGHALLFINPHQPVLRDRPVVRRPGAQRRRLGHVGRFVFRLRAAHHRPQ